MILSLLEITVPFTSSSSTMDWLVSSPSWAAAILDANTATVIDDGLSDWLLIHNKTFIFGKLICFLLDVFSIRTR